MHNKKKWYQKTLWILVSLMMFFPLGLFLMWKHSNWKKGIKIGVSSIYALIIVGGLLSDGDTNTQTTTTQVVQEQETAKPVKEEAPVEPVEPPKPKTVIEQISEICPNANVYSTGSILYIKQNMKRTKRDFYHIESREVYNDIHDLVSELPEEITTVCVWYETEFIDKLGNETTDTVYRINIPVDTLKAINWDNYLGIDFEKLSEGDMYAWHGLK